MKNTIIPTLLLSSLTLFSGGPPPISPPACEWLCYNLRVNLEDSNGNQIPAFDNVMIGEYLTIQLILGTNYDIPVYCCDNYFIEYSVTLYPEGEILNSHFTGLWGFAHAKHNDPAPEITVDIGTYQVKALDIINNCYIIFGTDTYQRSTGSPHFEYHISKLAGVTVFNPDINDDGIVNALDLIIILVNWGQDNTADINCDGVINIEDLLLVLIHWT